MEELRQRSAILLVCDEGVSGIVIPLSFGSNFQATRWNFAIGSLKYLHGDNSILLTHTDCSKINDVPYLNICDQISVSFVVGSTRKEPATRKWPMSHERNWGTGYERFGGVERLCCYQRGDGYRPVSILRDYGPIKVLRPNVRDVPKRSQGEAWSR